MVYYQMFQSVLLWSYRRIFFVQKEVCDLLWGLCKESFCAISFKTNGKSSVSASIWGKIGSERLDLNLKTLEKIERKRWFVV